MLKSNKSKIIAISQRVTHEGKISETRDCLDQRWTVLLESLGLIPLLIPNKSLNIEEYLNHFNVYGIILSGGNDVSPSLYDGDVLKSDNISVERDHTEQNLIRYAENNSIPLLGVCRGMQMLNVYYGGSIDQDISNDYLSHVGTYHEVSISDDQYREQWQVNKIKVNSYHNQGITIPKLSNHLRLIATSSDGMVEAIVHKNKETIMGIQWHPERESVIQNLDKVIIESFFNRF